MKWDQQLFPLDQVLDPISKRDNQQLLLFFLQSRITKYETFVVVFISKGWLSWAGQKMKVVDLVLISTNQFWDA